MKLKESQVLFEGNATFSTDETNGFSAIAKGEGVIKKASFTFSFNFEKEDKLFLNGYQSWTYSPEWELDGVDKSLKYCPKNLDKRFGFSRYGDGYFYRKNYLKGVLHGYSYAYIRRGKKFILLGSLNENSAFLRIVFKTKLNEIVLESDAENRAVNGEFPLVKVRLYEGEEDEVFTSWFADMGIAPPTAKKQTGYTSWYNYYQNISEEILLRDLKGFSALPKKPDIFQIDDGFEEKVGDWLKVDKEKFPNGLAPVVKEIVSNGYRAGLWLAPFVCEKYSSLFKEHPEWLKRDEKGELVFGGGNWSGMYALDFYNEEVRAYLREVVSHYKEMGVSLFKLDFLYAVCMVPDSSHTRAEIMAEAMKFLKEICGESEILGCGVPLASAFGRVAYCRIGMDMSLQYDDAAYMRLFHSERPSTKHTMKNTVYRRELSGRAFLNDPDVFLLREENVKFNELKKRSLATVNALFGGVLFASDDFGKYDEEKKEFYSHLLSLQRAKVTSVEQSGRDLFVEYELDGKTFREKLYFA